MGTKRRGLLGIMFALALALGLVPGMAMTAYAASTSYVDGSGAPKTADATALTSTTNSWTDGSWYIVPAGGLTISGRITVNGTVNLILRDGATLTASAGITTTGATLNIYAQSAGTGTLTAKGSNGARNSTGGSAGIGGCGGAYEENGGAGGTVSIFGGTVTATGGNSGGGGAGAGIGGGGAGLGRGQTGGAGGTVSIFGGTVTATGGDSEDGGAGAGIGGGGKEFRGSAGANGALTLGKGVKLYSGTNNSGTVLDGSDSTARSYSGSRPQKMFAEFAVGPDKTALSAAIAAAQTLHDSIKDNTDYADIAGTLKTAIDTAQGVYDNASADQDAVDGATTTITTAKTTAVVGMINKLPAASDVTTSDKGTIEAVRAAYASLSETEQGKVDANTLKKLTDAEAALKDATDTAAANTVGETINALPAADQVTTNDKNAIEAARAAYDALTDDQKAKVSADTLKKLTDAEDALAAATVSNTINALPAAADVTTANKDAIEAARAAYDALTDDQKAKVSADTLAKLTDAEDALAAATVSNTINALPAAASVATADKAAIEAARAAYDALTDDQKAKVSADTLKKLTDAEDALAAATVSNTINALPAASDVTTADKDAIEAARAAYDALTDDQKAKVSADTLAKLTDAEAALKDATDAAAANTVGETINALPAADQVTTNDKDAIEAARAAYDALTDDQKAKVSADTLKKLTDAEDALAAATVGNTIKALPAAASVTTADKAAIEAARKAYDALTPDQKAKVPADALKKLEDAEKALAAAEKEAADAAAAKAAADKIGALPAADKVTASDKAAIEAARKAYDALTPDQKAKVPADALKKLEAAEKALADAQKTSTSIAKAKVVLAKTTMAYTGKALTPKVKSVTLNGKKLKAKTDYTVKYKNNKKLGKATVTVTGKGSYKGSAKATFNIKLAKPKVSIATSVGKKALTAKWAKVKGAKSYQVQWRAQGGKWKAKTVKSTKATIKGLKAGKAYDVRVRAVSGKSKGVWSAQKHRWLAKQAGVKATSKKAGTVKVSWKKNAKANAGFKVTVRYSKTGKAVATKTVAAGKTSATIKGLKAGKRAWVMVQPLRKAGGATYSGQTARAKSAVKVAGKAKAVKAQSAGSVKLTTAAL